jgi:PAS domain S-box-containing protein
MLLQFILLAGPGQVGVGAEHIHAAGEATPFFQDLFKIYTPRQICMLGEAPVIWLHVVSDLLIGLAYFSIPVALAMLLRRRRDLAFSSMFWLFAAFILACGTTHFLSIAAIWTPIYRLDGLVKLATGLVSLFTAGALWRSLPRIEALPSPREVLRASEVAWQGTFENAAVGIANVAMDGRWMRLNDALCRITGYSRQELLATTFQAITHPEDVDADVALAAKVAVGEIPTYSIEKRYLRKDGSIVWASLTVSLHQTRLPGEEPYFIAVVQDITTRKAAEEAVQQSEEQLRQLADGIPQLAWMAHPDGSIFWYNRRWYEYTGTTPERMQGWGWQEVHDPQVLPSVIERWKDSVATAQPFEMEFPLRGADGAFRTFLTRVEPIRDGQGRVLRWFGTNTDVEDHRRLLLERERLLGNERTARAAAEQASRLKDEFLATVSHELRTPLNAIFGWSQILLGSSITDPEIRKGVESIHRNARSQVQIVDDLLDMSRIISGEIRLDVQAVDLSQILDRTLDTIRPAAVAKGVRLETTITSSCEIQGDPGRLQQVFWNLFNNAIRFTPSGGTMQVALESVNSHLEVSIRDTGEGIAPDFLPFVFDRFRQQDGSTTRRHGGLGVGLSLVKTLVELHGGQVRASSAGVGKGATFVVQLPAGPAELTG